MEWGCGGSTSSLVGSCNATAGLRLQESVQRVLLKYSSKIVIKKTFSRRVAAIQCHQTLVNQEGARPLSNAQQSLHAVEDGMNFWGRLVKAWHILFPGRLRLTSNAQVAKRRLKMILISDRCSVNDDAKRKIVGNIVGALADFVEIECEDKVELNVSSNAELGTVYYVTVPVRRVRPQYQEYSNDLEDSELTSDVDSAAQLIQNYFQSQSQSNLD